MLKRRLHRLFTKTKDTSKLHRTTSFLSCSRWGAFFSGAGVYSGYLHGFGIRSLSIFFFFVGCVFWNFVISIGGRVSGGT